MTPHEINAYEDQEAHLKFEMLLADISSRFTGLAPGDVDREILDAQRRICDALGLDLSVLWQWLPENQGLLTITHLYRRFEGPPVPDLMNASEYFPFLMKQVLAGKVVALSSPAELPAEAAQDRKSIEYYGIKSLANLPLWVGTGPPLGIVSFHSMLEEHAWLAETVDRLQLVAKAFANALGRKRSEEVLRNSEARLALAADSAEAGLWVLDWSACAFWVTGRTRAIFGYGPDEVITLERFEASVLPEDLELVRQTIERSRHECNLVNVQYRILRGDGCIRWIDTRGRPYFTSSGEPERLMGIAVDITDRKRMEEASRASEARLASGVDLAGLGFFEIVFGEGITYLDERARTLFGVPAGVDHGAPAIEFWEEHIHPDDLQDLLNARSQLRDEGADRISKEYRYLHPDLGLRWLHHLSRIDVRDDCGKAVHLIGVIRDITESKRAEEELRQSYAEIERLKDRLQAESDYLKAEIRQTLDHGRIIVQSSAMKKVLRLVEQVAPTDSSVLICGETGTGKELIAQEIHQLGPRRDHVMVKVNCAALPSGLVESELFGREKGAYTGALTRQVGRFEVADGSTIFLDEIGELPLEAQAKLLNVLQEGEFERLGSPKTIRVNVRVIAATNRDLAEDVRKGRFREDLYYRLNVFPIQVPALRERPEDIPLLVWTFLDEFCSRMGKKITQVSRKTMEALQRHPWPGNVRQLRNIIEHGAIITTGHTLIVPVPDPAATTDATPTQSLADTEREHILKTLEKTGWRIKGPKGAAALLGLKPSTLYSRMEKLGISNRRKKDNSSES